MTQLYAFDLSSKYKLFTHEVKARKDPVSGAVLIPAYATEEPIIAEKDGYARGFVDGQWQYFIDQRGTEYWDEGGTQHAITEVNIALPEGALLTAPTVEATVETSAEQTATPTDVASQARAQRNTLLTATDYLMLPDYVLPDSSHSTKADWVAYRQALRNLSAQAGFPNDIDWPVRPDAEVIEEGLIPEEPTVEMASEEAQIEKAQVKDVTEEKMPVVASLEKTSEISSEPASNEVTTAMITAVTQAVLQAVNGQAVNTQAVASDLPSQEGPLL